MDMQIACTALCAQNTYVRREDGCNGGGRGGGYGGKRRVYMEEEATMVAKASCHRAKG